jgi:hypothetical protein
MRPQHLLTINKTIELYGVRAVMEACLSALKTSPETTLIERFSFNALQQAIENVRPEIGVLK